VHWHGLRIPIQMDGVPQHSQPEVPPGGSFTYDFVVPDAGLFWYHPHIQSAAQVGFGLYGACSWKIRRTVGVDGAVLVQRHLDHDKSGELTSTAAASWRLFGREGTMCS
jgi:FtsP/CotA-like multicopper oxidase with cupredoxin domain